jgi:hypothetical protein
MLCSLAELGWSPDAPDEVALLRNVTPGESLDKVTATDWQSLVINRTSKSDSNPIQDAKPLFNVTQESHTAKSCRDGIRVGHSSDQSHRGDQANDRDDARAILPVTDPAM